MRVYRIAQGVKNFRQLANLFYVRVQANPNRGAQHNSYYMDITSQYIKSESWKSHLGNVVHNGYEFLGKYGAQCL